MRAIDWASAFKRDYQREQFGQGRRMYYVHRGEVLIVMLGGDDRSKQLADIRRATPLAKRLED